MLSKTALRKSLEMTKKWFKESGVMIPENGLWGVAERVLLVDNNKTAQKTLNSFPAWTPQHPPLRAGNACDGRPAVAPHFQVGIRQRQQGCEPA